MKMLLSLIASSSFVSSIALTTVSCSEPADKYLRADNIKKRLSNFSTRHFETNQEFEEEFKNIFNSYEYITFNKNQRPLEDHWLLITDFKYEYTKENQVSAVKDTKISLNIFSAKENQWELNKPTVASTLILVGVTENIEKISNLDTNVGQLEKYDQAKEVFLANNENIFSDGVELLIDRSGSETKLYIVGDEKYYSGKIELEFSLKNN
ncbi:hypothetical protein [Spiroplasma sp. BIUS-1]|uniref:hypothetical protein n=1 Tax=Spiroplasma sp. BIUS-1 TaxID=216964 RepID=UPI001396FDBF|nr:hypothetical protein [Spiroplasma sp. BIUS-1]QHX36675.1 hypothetical protein SBIUS_v1c04220 [Spiroplasma sp. BIUS-1]